jgi:hypothetical protein
VSREILANTKSKCINAANTYDQSNEQENNLNSYPNYNFIAEIKKLSIPLKINEKMRNLSRCKITL